MQQLKVSEISSLHAVAPSLIGKLLAGLAAHEVRYCHWKSNWRISRWLDGEGDLDLLVKREDIGKFLSVLDDLGFKKALTEREMELPGVVNFYGYDPNTGKIINVHAHYQLVFGHDLTNNYRLPIEDAIIRAAIRRGEIFVAAPEMELILFVVQKVLKYSIAESVARKVFRKMHANRQAILDEIAYLETQIDPMKLDVSLQNYFPMIESELFKDCLSALKSDSSFPRMLRNRWKLENSLSAYSRMSRPVEVYRRARRRINSLLRKFVWNKPIRKRFENGGALIAIVGGDGAGKTACVHALNRWLSRKFIVKAVHFGKPPKSLLTSAVAVSLKINSFFGGKSWAPPASRTMPAITSENGLLQNLRWLCIARDRYRLYKKLRRHAARGGIVVCDRYPVPNLRLMDGPKIKATSKNAISRRLLKFFSRIENQYYGKIIAPDSLFVLRVEPNIAVGRKTSEGMTHVFSRSSELWNFNWEKTNAHVIDTNRTLDEVASEMRSAVWNRL